jgi:hypothetical protein
MHIQEFFLHSLPHQSSIVQTDDILKPSISKLAHLIWTSHRSIVLGPFPSQHMNTCSYSERKITDMEQQRQHLQKCTHGQPLDMFVPQHSKPTKTERRHLTTPLFQDNGYNFRLNTKIRTPPVDSRTLFSSSDSVATSSRSNLVPMVASTTNEKDDDTT